MEFVDTNVLLYAYDADAGDRHEAAFALVDRLWRERRGALSIQVLQEFYVNVTRKAATPLAPSPRPSGCRAWHGGGCTHRWLTTSSPRPDGRLGTNCHSGTR